MLRLFCVSPQSVSCPLFSGLWNKERDVQLCQGLKSPQDSEILSGTQNDLVCNKTKQKTAPSFRGSRKKSNHWKLPQCHHSLPAAWGPSSPDPIDCPEQCYWVKDLWSPEWWKSLCLSQGACFQPEWLWLFPLVGIKVLMMLLERASKQVLVKRHLNKCLGHSPGWGNHCFCHLPRSLLRIMKLW